MPEFSEPASATGSPVLIALDVVIGLPLAFTRAAGVDGFLEALAWLGRSGGLDETCTIPTEWTPNRPFFRVAPGRGGLSRFIDSAGSRGTLMRQIERHTGAKPVFAVSGIPGTVGSGSRAIWKELAPLIDDARRDFRVWPFEGALRELLASDCMTVAETYPRAAYALALDDTLPTKLRPLAKSRRVTRIAAVRELRLARWFTREEVELRETTLAEDNEDDFDAMMAAAGIVRLCIEQAPLSCGLVDPITEGGILPTGMIEFRDSPPPVRSAAGTRRRHTRRG